MKKDQIEKPCSCEPEDCDTFQFMAKNLGMKVLHPGGLDATEKLAKQCGISSDMIVLDAGCGSGSSSIFLAAQYGCQVIGVDIDQNLLLKAYESAQKKKLLERVSFRFADIEDLPFPDETFDGAIIQAALIFTEKSKILQELFRKIRQDGFIGIVELAWKSYPPTQIIERVRDVLCAAAANTELHSEWISLLRRSGFTVVNAKLWDLNFSLHGILRNEGAPSALRIMIRGIFDEYVRRRTSEVTNLFNETGNYLGYGIYVGKKRY